MAYTVVSIPRDTWTEVASQSKTMTIYTGGYLKVYAYEGINIPTELPIDSDPTQPFAKISNNSTDKEDFVEKAYENLAGEKLWIYSKGSDTKVILQN